MAELKTRPTSSSVKSFLDSIPDESRRRDCRKLVPIMKRATGASPKMWGPSIVGFGEYHYRYESGREGDWFLAGFSPRKNDLTLYIVAGFDGFADLMKRLGKHKTGKSCLYVRSLEDIDLEALEKLVTESARRVASRHSAQ